MIKNEDVGDIPQVPVHEDAQSRLLLRMYRIRMGMLVMFLMFLFIEDSLRRLMLSMYYFSKIKNEDVFLMLLFMRTL
jgi:hypothetical protein